MSAPSPDVLARLLSNYQRLIDFRLAEWEEGRAVILLDIRDDHLNRSGGLHGGVLTTLIDAAGSFSGNYVPPPDMPRPSTTLSLTTNFIAGATRGLVRAEGVRAGGGSRTFFANMKIVTGDILLATGSAVYRMMNIKS